MRWVVIALVAVFAPSYASAQLRLGPQDLGSEPTDPNLPSHQELLSALRDCNSKIVMKSWPTDPKTGNPKPGSASGQPWDWGGSAEDVTNCKKIETEVRGRKSANDALKLDTMASARIRALAARLDAANAPTSAPTPAPTVSPTPPP